MPIDPDKARMAQLSFKKSTEGLTSAEEQELAMLRAKAQRRAETPSGNFETT